MTLPTFDEIRRQEPRTDLTAMPGGLLPEPKERRSLPTFEEIRAGRPVMTPADGPKEATLADIPDADLPESIRDQGSRVRNAEFYAEQFGLQGLSIDDAYDYEPQLNELIWGPGTTTESANAKVAAYRKQAVEETRGLIQGIGAEIKATAEADSEIWEAAKMTVWGTGPYGEESVAKAWWDILKLLAYDVASRGGKYHASPGEILKAMAPTTQSARWWMGREEEPEKAPEEVHEELVEKMPGLAEAIVPAAGEGIRMGVDFAFVYPTLFRLAGVPIKAIGKIPKVQKAIQALGGTEWVAKFVDNHPHITYATTELSRQYLQGHTVHGTMRAMEAYLDGKSPLEVMKEIPKGWPGGLMAMSFTIAGMGDQAIYMHRSRAALTKARLAKADAEVRAIGRAKLGSRYKHPTDEQALRAGMGTAEGKAAYEHMLDDLGRIDKILSAQLEMLRGSQQGLYQLGQRKMMNPFEAAVYIVNNGWDTALAGKLPYGPAKWQTGVTPSGKEGIKAMQWRHRAVDQAHQMLRSPDPKVRQRGKDILDWLDKNMPRSERPRRGIVQETRAETKAGERVEVARQKAVQEVEQKLEAIFRQKFPEALPQAPAPAVPAEGAAAGVAATVAESAPVAKTPSAVREEAKALETRIKELARKVGFLSVSEQRELEEATERLDEIFEQQEVVGRGIQAASERMSIEAGEPLKETIHRKHGKNKEVMAALEDLDAFMASSGRLPQLEELDSYQSFRASVWTKIENLFGRSSGRKGFWTTPVVKQAVEELAPAFVQQAYIDVLQRLASDKGPKFAKFQSTGFRGRGFAENAILGASGEAVNALHDWVRTEMRKRQDSGYGEIIGKEATGRGEKEGELVGDPIKWTRQVPRMFRAIEVQMGYLLERPRQEFLSTEDKAKLDELIEEANQKRIPNPLAYVVRQSPDLAVKLEAVWEEAGRQLFERAHKIWRGTTHRSERQRMLSEPRASMTPTWAQELEDLRHAPLEPQLMVDLGAKLGRGRGPGELSAAESKLVVRHGQAQYAKEHEGIRMRPGAYPSPPTKQEIVENHGDEWYEANKERNIQITGRVRYDRDSGRLVCEIYSEGTGRTRTLAEELYHVVFEIVRAGMPGRLGQIQKWFDKRAKHTDQKIDEAFAKELALIETGELAPSKSDLDNDVIKLAQDIFSGKHEVSQETMEAVKEEFQKPRYSVEVEGESPLIIPADIYEGREQSRPHKRSQGMTKAEVALFGKKVSALVRFAQIHQEEVGYKKGVADTVENSRRALDALRMRMAEIREVGKDAKDRAVLREKERAALHRMNQVDALNLVVTYIPREYRGVFLNRVVNARTAAQVGKLADAIEAWIDDFEQRTVIQEFKKFKGKVVRESRRGEVPFGELPMHLARQIDELLNLFDPVKLTEQKKQSLESRQEWYSRMASLLADGYDAISARFDKDTHSYFVIPRHEINELRRLAQIPIQEVTPDEIRWVISQVDHMLEMHQLKGDSKIRRRWEALHGKINTARQQVKKQSPKPETLGAWGLIKRAANIGQANLRTLIGYAMGTEQDAALEVLFEDLIKGNNRRIAKYREFVEAWEREIARAGIKWSDVSKTFEEVVTIQIGGRQVELTRDDLLTLYAYTIADGTLRRLLTTEGLNITTHRRSGLFMKAYTHRVGTPTLVELRAIADQIPDVHKKLLDIYFKVNHEVQAPAINEVSMETQNTEIARDERYMSVHREAQKAYSGFKLEEMAAAIESVNRYKPRTGGTGRMNVRGFTREVMTGMQMDAFKYGMEVPMMNARAMLMNKQFVAAMKDNGHAQVLNYIGTMMDRIQVNASEQALLDQAFTQLFTKVGKSLLSLRLTGGAIQTASLPAAFGVIPRKYFSLSVPSKEAVKKLMDKYPSLWLRWKAKQFDYALGAISAQNAFEVMLFGQQPVTDKMLNHYTWGDQIAVVNIYRAAEQMVKDTTDFEVGSEQYEAALQKLFDRAMETQPMWDTLHRSVITTDTAFFAKGFTWFMSARNAQLNVLQQAIDGGGKGRITPTQRNAIIGDIVLANFMVSFLRNLIKTGIQAVGAAFLIALGLREPPDEEEVKALARRLGTTLPIETVTNLVGLNVVGQMATAAAMTGVRASKYKWSAYDARNLRTGNLGVDLYTDVILTGAEGFEFGVDLVTMRQYKGTKYKKGEYAFVDSGERFLRDMALLTAYRLGLPLEGPMSDFYYPLKRAHGQEHTRNKGKKAW